MTPSRPLSPEITQHRGVLRFSTPLRLAVIAVTVMAVVALGLLLVPRGGTPPIADVSPTATVEPTAPSLEPSPSLTPSPTLDASPSATPVPTLAATPPPVLSNWAGMEWSDPFEPFPRSHGGTEPWHFVMHDLVQWKGAWVAAGEWSNYRAVCNEASFERSEDGVNWNSTAVFYGAGYDDVWDPLMCPHFLVPKTQGLLAVGQQRLWASTNGMSWREVDSPSWLSLWSPNFIELVDVAYGAGGILAIGSDRETGHAMVAHSPDGHVWQRVSLPASEQPMVRDVATYAGGFVIVGRDGQPDGEASSDHPAVVPGMGRAAVWTSTDGVTWTQASVQADRVQGGGMTQALVGSHGLFAVGINTAVEYYPLGLQGSGEVVSAWASPDGSSWAVAGSLGENLPPMALMDSDGTTMVGLGVRQPSVGPDSTAWASVDGLHWTSLAVSGPVPDVSYLVLEPQMRDRPPDTALWVLPDGLLVVGPGEGVPYQPYSSQWFRFATAVVP